MLSLAIDLSSSILLCHFICKANRASGGIYLILFSLDWSIPFAISVLEAKQLYLDCWWTQIKHLFPPSPSFLSCLHFFPLRAMGELLLYGPFISICILFSPIIFFLFFPLLFCSLFLIPFSPFSISSQFLTHGSDYRSFGLLDPKFTPSDIYRGNWIQNLSQCGCSDQIISLYR